jgi:hypothetical protein
MFVFITASFNLFVRVLSSIALSAEDSTRLFKKMAQSGSNNECTCKDVPTSQILNKPPSSISDNSVDTFQIENSEPYSIELSERSFFPSRLKHTA